MPSLQPHQSQPNWLAFWQAAAMARYGVVLAVSDVPGAKAALYRVRAASKDPALMGLQIRTSIDDPNGELWLVRGEDKKNGA